MSERLIIFCPLFYIWSLFIAKKLRLLESIYQRLQGEERREVERRVEERRAEQGATSSGRTAL